MTNHDHMIISPLLLHFVMGIRKYWSNVLTYFTYAETFNAYLFEYFKYAEG